MVASLEMFNTETPLFMMTQLIVAMHRVVEIKDLPVEIKAGFLRIIQTSIVGGMKTGLFDPDQSGRLLQTNHASMEKLGYPEPDVKGADFQQLPGNMWDPIPIEDKLIFGWKSILGLLRG